jgi:hypothetical protein
MPSKSKTQQRLMGVAYAVKSGDMQLSDVDVNYKDKVKDLVDGMTLKQLKDFAETKHDDLPEEVEEGISPANIGGMGEVSLPTDTQPGSGDVPAGRKSEDDEEDKEKQLSKMKKLIPAFENFIRPSEIDEARDFNDPVLMKMRAAQMKLNQKAAKKNDEASLSPAKAKKIQALKDERKEIMRDMEQEAEMEGGEIADRYGDMLNKIDKQIIKLGGNPLSEAKLSGLSGFGKLEYTIDDLNLSYGWAGTLSDHFDNEDKAILLTQQAIKDLGKTIGLSQKEALGLLNSKAGRHMADLFIDGGAVDSTSAAVKYFGNKAKAAKYAKQTAASQFESEVNELRTASAGSTSAAFWHELEDRKYELKKPVKGVSIGNHAKAVLPKGTILYNLPGGLFAKHPDLADYKGHINNDKFGVLIKKDHQVLQDIEKNSKVLESTELVNEWGSSDQSIMNQQIHKDAGSPKKMPSPFDRKLRAAAEDAVDWHWDDWPEYKRDRAGLIDNAVRSYLRSYFKKDFEMMVRMFEPVDESAITEAAFVIWYEDQDGKHLLGTFKNKRAAEKYKSEEEDEILNTKGVESVGMMSKDMWDKKEAPYIKEDVNEAKSIAKIQKEWGNVTSIMKDVVAKYKTAEGQEKEDLLDELKSLTASKKKLEAELDAAVGLKDMDAELAESTVNEMTSDAAVALADEVSGELYTARLKGKSVTINATTTTKTWEDGVPVLKHLARGKAKPVTFSLYQRPFKVVHDVAHNWFYFTDGGKWYGLHGDEGYFEPSDLPFTMEISESLNESIQHGFYYFPKASVDSSMQPAKGETKYAVICHNTVQMGKNIMYLKSANSGIGQNFDAHVLSVHDSEDEAFKAYQDAVKYDEGKTASCVSFAYGKLTVKGSNLPFAEIGGERKKIK